jgi:hypothetical protein
MLQMMKQQQRQGELPPGMEDESLDDLGVDDMRAIMAQMEAGGDEMEGEAPMTPEEMQMMMQMMGPGGGGV